MARGRILSEDIAALRARTPIEDIIGERVTLRRSGSGLTGLCPFHDETSPSFSVSPSKGLYLCFGCQESGDAITFIQKTEGLSFIEAVERLADKVGFTLRYADADPNYVPAPPGQRARLLEMNRAATHFFRQALRTDPNAHLGMTYLRERGFTDDDIDQFDIGYAPAGRDGVTAHLRTKGYTEDEIVTGGIAGRSDDGRIYDRFRGRLTWPIRDISGEVIGFGARRLSAEDKGPKWLNTPETPLYHKSEVLYGIDTARKAIAADRTVVVVEGYGDVMACHLSGIPHAVAACGTSFGDGHIRIIRRLLRDDQAYAGKVIFTFDGDEAGQKAALRAFRENAKFASQTYVAVAPEGMDPLDLRLARGDDAVRDLVASAVPLVEFAIKSALALHDLSLTEGRINALRSVAPMLAGIKDLAMRTDYVRRVGGWLALPERSVQSAVAYAAKSDSETPLAPAASTAAADTPADAPAAAPPYQRPDPADLALFNERETLKCLLQLGAADQVVPHLTAATFTHPSYSAVFTAIAAVSAEADASSLLEQVREHADGQPWAPLVNELAIEPLRGGDTDPTGYQESIVNRLLDLDAERRIAGFKVQLASASADQQAEILGWIMTLERYRRELRG